MRVEVLVFASLREAFGGDRIEIEVPEPTDVAALRRSLAALRPDLEATLASCRVAVDLRFVEDEASIATASEVAVVPPVAGG